MENHCNGVAGSKKLRVAIIGAGASGIAALKCCVDEGLDPVCYELTDDLGGLWNYREKIIDDRVSCVMKSTVINTSKEMMCFSDYPIPKEWPNFLHNSLVLEYFRNYTKHFGLDRYIQFGIRVLNIKKMDGGRWTLDIEDVKKNEKREEVFDAVFIATGHHAKPNRPAFEGLDTFSGEVLHTHDYRGTAARFEHRKVLVIGIGNSGGDVAVEISRLTKQTYLSSRRGAWIWNRVSERGLPIDIIAVRRINEYAKKAINVDRKMEGMLMQKFDHEMYGLKPDFPPFSCHPTINDELPNRIVSGSVVLKPNVARIDGATVHFSDGSHVDDVDTIVLATGYHVTFPFMQDQIFEVYDNHVGLYKYVFPPDLESDTLAVLGCVQPWGAIMTISEMQARVACKVFKGEVTLPSSDEMWTDIRLKEKLMAERYTKSQRHTIQVDYIPYMDELAEIIGCKPKLGHLLLRDPRLWYQVVFGPASSYQYRLHGPGAWEGAREAIMSQFDRVAEPFKTRQVQLSETAGTGLSLTRMCLMALIAVVFYWIFCA